MTAFTDPVTADPLARRGRAVALVLWGVTVASAVALVVGEAMGVAQGEDVNLLTRVAGCWESLVLSAGAVVCGASLFTGLAWTRWAAATAFGAGAVWNLLRPEAQAALPVVLGLSVVWAGTAVVLAVWQGFAAFQARQLEANYERLLGPLQSHADARRWLATVDRWSGVGAVTRGVRRRIGRVMTHRMAELGLPPGDLSEPIAALGDAAFRDPIGRRWQPLQRLAGVLRRVMRRSSATPPR